jgi:hypothetical protein
VGQYMCRRSTITSRNLEFSNPKDTRFDEGSCTNCSTHRTRFYAHTLRKDRAREVRDGAGTVRLEKFLRSEGELQGGYGQVSYVKNAQTLTGACWSRKASLGSGNPTSDQTSPGEQCVTTE